MIKTEEATFPPVALVSLIDVVEITTGNEVFRIIFESLARPPAQ
jgi:hypothetical protein